MTEVPTNTTEQTDDADEITKTPPTIRRVASDNGSYIDFVIDNVIVLRIGKLGVYHEDRLVRDDGYLYELLRTTLTHMLKKALMEDFVSTPNVGKIEVVPKIVLDAIYQEEWCNNAP